MHHRSRLRPHLVLLLGCLGLAATASAGSLVPITVPELWQRAEWRIEGAPEAENNFDPEQIRIDATITSPAGRAITVPAFWFQDHTRALVDGKQVLTPRGSPHWRLRFTPTETGAHAVDVVATQPGQAARSVAATRFTVGGTAPAGQHGWVRVAGDKRSLETSDGRMLRLIGANVCWGGDRGTYSYDAWFPAMRDAGENFARLWFAPWSMGIEHNPGTLNRYDQAAAWQADYVLELAERCGLYVLVAMDHHGMFMSNDPAWGGSNNWWLRGSPYAVENGGPCESPNAFFTRADARRIYQKRLRYVIARYGYSPRMLSWQFFNEIDNAYIPRSDLVAADVVAWHQAMGRWLRENDPHQHLVSTSLTGASDRPEIWTLPEMDFTVYHSYGEPDPLRYVGRLTEDFVCRYQKPTMIGEIGTNHLSWTIANDPYLRGFRQGLWGGLLGGSVGTSMTWWWESIHEDRVYPLYTVLRDVMARAGWDRPGWEAAALAEHPPVPDAIGDVVPGGEPFSAAVPLNQLRLNRVSGEAVLASPLAVARAAERLSSYLHGSRNPQFQQSARMTGWFAEGARLVFRVNSVAADADLVVRIDAAEKLRVPLVNRDGLAALTDEIDQEFSVDLPPGRHVVEVAHTGRDWVNLKSMRLERLLPAAFPGGWQFPTEAVALRRGDAAAVVYVRSPYVAWPAGALRYNPPIVTGATVTLLDWSSPGTRVTWIDPVTGRSVAEGTATAAEGRLVLEVPAFADDLVALIRESSP